MMHRLEKKIDDRIDTKLGPVMDRLSALENSSSSTRSGPSSESGAGNFGSGGGGAKVSKDDLDAGADGQKFNS